MVVCPIITLKIMSHTQTRTSEIFGTLMLVWSSHFLADVMIGIFPVYKTIAGLDLAIAGLIAAICPFIGEGMQVVFGSLGDKGYRRVLLQLGLLGTCAAAFFAYTTNYWVLAFLYLITCLGSGAFHPSAVAIASSLTQKRRALFVTIFASGGYLGFAISQLVFSEAYFNFGGQTALLALPNLFLVLLISLLGFQGRGSTPSPSNRRYGFSAFKKLFRCKALVNIYWMQVCNQAVYWGIIFLLPDVLSERGLDPWITYGGGHMCFILGAALIIVPGGYLADKHSPKVVLLAGTLSGAVLLYTFLGMEFSAPGTLLMLLSIGATLGMSNPVAVALGNHILPSRPGLVSAFLMGLVWCISEGIGPGGGGLMTKLFTENAPVKSLAILGTLLFVGLNFTARLPYRVTEEYDIDREQ